jgi:hypothetical protein
MAASAVESTKEELRQLVGKATLQFSRTDREHRLVSRHENYNSRRSIMLEGFAGFGLAREKRKKAHS